MEGLCVEGLCVEGLPRMSWVLLGSVSVCRAPMRTLTRRSLSDRKETGWS